MFSKSSAFCLLPMAFFFWSLGCLSVFLFDFSIALWSLSVTCLLLDELSAIFLECLSIFVFLFNFYIPYESFPKRELGKAITFIKMNNFFKNISVIVYFWACLLLQSWNKVLKHFHFAIRSFLLSEFFHCEILCPHLHRHSVSPS